MAVRKRVSDLERLSATADVQLDVTYDDKPCIALFDSAVELLSVVDADSKRSMVSLFRRSNMDPLRLVADEIVWDQRRLRVSNDVAHLAEAAEFVHQVNK